MRSLATKLTLAFVLVGVLGVILFALLLAQRSRVEFRRFLSERDQAVLAESLAEYHRRHGGWAGVEEAIQAQPLLERSSQGAVLADASGRIVLGSPGHPVGDPIGDRQLEDAVVLRNRRGPVGFLYFPGQGARNVLTSDDDFQGRILRLALASAAATIGAALIAGGLLARTLTRPLTALTDATRAMAAGDLQQRVDVQTQDEIGELARSFNQMSEDLAHASFARKQMTADLAHELRTPLTILGGYAEGLREQRVEASPALFALMHDEVLHLQRLVEDLRVLSLADAGELPLNRRSVDASALLERAFLANAQRATDLHVELRLDVVDAMPSVRVDTDRMAQVLNNLVGNALRHSGGGEVILRGRSEKGAALLAVQDSGQGISAEDLPYVFERFYRGDKSRHREDEAASGLGLAIARAIVEAQEGSISVDSIKGRGATFTIRLPVAANLTPQM